MSELQKYVALGPLRAAQPGDEVNEHIWYATPDVDAARAADRATIADLQAKCESLHSEIESVRLGAQLIQVADIISERELKQRAERIEQLEAENKRLSDVDTENAGLEYAADNDLEQLSSYRRRIEQLEAENADLRGIARRLIDWHEMAPSPACAPEIAAIVEWSRASLAAADGAKGG